MNEKFKRLIIAMGDDDRYFRWSLYLSAMLILIIMI
jgi:hypothetical protein